MTSRTLLWFWAILPAVTAAGCVPAVKPAAPSPTGEQAFQEAQITIQSLLDRVSQSKDHFASSSQDLGGQQPDSTESVTTSSQAAAGHQSETSKDTFSAMTTPPAPAAGQLPHEATTSYEASGGHRPDSSGDTSEPSDASVSAVHDLLKQSSADLFYLKGLSTRMSVPDQYVASVRQQSALLSGLGSKGRLTPVELSKLQAVAADFHTKALHAQKGEAAAFEPVAVNVHTYLQRKETNGYEVWFVAAGYFDEPSSFTRFLRFSSPTSRMMFSGTYCMWTKDKKGATSPKQFLDIGNGKKAEDLDLDVP